jgi:choline dehydrogenase-like flavoprotein
MKSALIVGSGASGVHLAKTLIDLGCGVTMLDVGHERPEPVMPDADFDGLKDRLDDPAEPGMRPDDLRFRIMREQDEKCLLVTMRVQVHVLFDGKIDDLLRNFGRSRLSVNVTAEKYSRVSAMKRGKLPMLA